MNTEFEEKVDIDDLVLPSKPLKLSEIERVGIKQEPFEEVEHLAAFESDPDGENKFKLEMEENLLKLCKELDKEKSENSLTDFIVKRSLKIRQFVEMFAQYDSLERCHEIKPF